MDFFHQIDSHTTLLTPNRRLSAVYSKKYAEWQISQGNTTWQTLDILPLYPSWLERLWKDYLSATFEDFPFLLSTRKEQIIWEKILRDTPENEWILNISDTAKMAKSAWEILKRWRVKFSEPLLKLTEDSRVFLNWAAQFQKLCEKNHWLDQHSLADFLSEKITAQKIKLPKKIILLGFTELAPQYQFLLSQCEKENCSVESFKSINLNKHVKTIAITDQDKELSTMALWAKAQLQQGAKQIGCIVPNLESFRDKVSRIFSAVLSEDEFNISAGKNLTNFPVIQDALQLLSLPCKPFSIDTLSSLLRSPFIAGGEKERIPRALLQNHIQTMTSPTHLDDDYFLQILKDCPVLLTSCKNAMSLFKQPRSSSWSQIFNDILKTFGWPGERIVSSHEYQVIQNSWLPLLNEFDQCVVHLENINYKEALHYLNLLAANTVFQPESPEAPIQVLGLLEAADIPFNSSWVIGLDDTAWPSRPKPNPFIPMRLQKKLNMPNATAERELHYCQTLTQQLLQSAENVIFSYPLHCDDTELRPSSLIKNYETFTEAELKLQHPPSLSEIIFATQQIETITDTHAPTISEDEKIRGGVSIFKTQAQCGFKALMEIRLHTKKSMEKTLGLNPLDKGNTVHHAMEYIWKELKNSENLLLLSNDTLQNLIHLAAKSALEKINPRIFRKKRYTFLELKRLEKLLWKWLQIEKGRPPFSVKALEQKVDVTIGNISASFRVDRIDEIITDGKSCELIIDYKTGNTPDKSHWFGERLDEPQLPIYSLANPSATVGIAFAKINTKKMELVGASQFPLAMKSVAVLSSIPEADAKLWPEQIKIWEENLTKLSNDFFDGYASVNPKNRNETCEQCGLQAICRIHEQKILDDETHDTTS